ncbi:MAG: hypothetical protein ABUS49_13180 [Acidobacteriota bacterium]
MAKITRFHYDARTSGVSGRFTLPFRAIVPRQAVLQLPKKGGFVHQLVERFNFRDILMFDRAVAYAAGSFSRKDDAFDATASVILEGVNILNVVTAGRIVARIASSHPANGDQPKITPIGCAFENLRIAGHDVKVNLAVDTLVRCGTWKEFRAECERAPDSGAASLLHEEARRALGEPVIRGTLVRSIEGLGPEIERLGVNAIRIPDFGVLRFAEVTIAERRRTVTMLRFELGSTPAGAGDMGGVEGNGSGN